MIDIRAEIKKGVFAIAVSAALILSLCGSGCESQPQNPVLPSDTETKNSAHPDSSPNEAPGNAAARFSIPSPSAPGIATAENDKAAIDYSNASDGYVMVKFQEGTDKELRTLIDAPNGVRYTYTLKPGDYAVYPLTEGDGEYVIGVYEQTEGIKYKIVVSTLAEVSIEDPLMPFLTPSQYVKYDENSAVVAKAAELTADSRGLLDMISAVYNYVVSNFTFDDALAETVQSGYLPDVDAVLDSKKGICFDYSAVMAAMLRSRGVPTKLVVGFNEGDYHAWLNVHSPETGWINMVVFFDGREWMLMDPTLAGGDVDYIAIEADYEAKYQY